MDEMAEKFLKLCGNPVLVLMIDTILGNYKLCETTKNRTQRGENLFSTPAGEAWWWARGGEASTRAHRPLTLCTNRNLAVGSYKRARCHLSTGTNQS